MTQPKLVSTSSPPFGSELYTCVPKGKLLNYVSEILERELIKFKMYLSQLSQQKGRKATQGKQ